MGTGTDVAMESAGVTLAWISTASESVDRGHPRAT